MQILVIEDENDVRHNILEILSSDGFRSMEAQNGQTGVQLAKETLPDLILCDIKLPDIDGYQVLTELRQDPTTALIPFIFLTAKTDRTDMRQGMNLGADDYLTKPFRRVELLATIGARLQRSRNIAHMQRKVKELQQRNLEKDHIVSAASHDLRAPLTTIQLALQLLDTAAEEERQYYLNVALEACEQGDELIKNLLDLDRLEAGKVPIVLSFTNLQEQLAKVVPPFQVRTQEHQQRFHLDLPHRLSPILSDGISLRRVLSELLNNACKYTPPEGEIWLHACETVSPEGAAIVVFTVRNQAEIPAAELPRIFDKFYRIPRTSDAQQRGSGLGLPLVKHLVACLGGQLQVRSGGGWTTFSVELPRPTQPANHDVRNSSPATASA